MISRDDDGLGSIRWSSEIFSEPSPTSSTSGWMIRASVVAIVLAILVLIVVFESGTKAPNVSIQTEATPKPKGNHAPALDKKSQKLHNLMPPVAGFAIQSAQAAGSAMLAEDFVLGVELDGEARAYAINMMGKPESELLNDTLAGRSIAVTFCGTCQSPLIFSRQVAGQTLTLYVNGELFADNMIMKDVETGTEWAQLTGEAIQGPLKGHRLEQLPASGPIGRPGGNDTPQQPPRISHVSCKTTNITPVTRPSLPSGRSFPEFSGAWPAARRPDHGPTHSSIGSPSSTTPSQANPFSSCSTEEPAP